jgi:hypothetical protein
VTAARTELVASVVVEPHPRVMRGAVSQDRLAVLVQFRPGHADVLPAGLASAGGRVTGGAALVLQVVAASVLIRPRLFTLMLKVISLFPGVLKVISLFVFVLLTRVFELVVVAAFVLVFPARFLQLVVIAPLMLVGARLAPLPFQLPRGHQSR